MIAVFDNGCQYSDKVISFVEVDSFTQAEALGEVTGEHLEFVSPVVEWYKGSPASPYRFILDSRFELPAELVEKITLRLGPKFTANLLEQRVKDIIARKKKQREWKRSK